MTAWLDSGLIDLDYYSAVRGETFVDEVDAAEDLVRRGMPDRLSPNPLVDFLSLPPDVRDRWREGDGSAVVGFLTVSGHGGTFGPLAIPANLASARQHMIDVARRLRRESPPQAEQARETGPPTPRIEGRTSVVVPVHGKVLAATRAVREVTRLAQLSGDDVEVIAVDDGSELPRALNLAAALHELPGARLERLPARRDHAVACNHGLDRSTGDVVVLLAVDSLPRMGWLDPLRSALDDAAVAVVQPVLLRQGDDLIESAGLSTVDSPLAGLSGHPWDDAQQLRHRRLDAVSPQVVAVRADDLLSGGGLSAAETPAASTIELCQRITRRRTGGCRVAPDSRVTVPRRTEAPEQVATSRARRTRAAEGLRWSINLPSPAGPGGDVWGDTFFGDALARALRRAAQDVVVRRHGAHGLGPTHLDDVTLSLRGLRPVPPTPGQLNVLWVISHPDEVTAEELGGYDVVCAASLAWSAEMTALSGREVVPLLQASEFAPPPSAAPGADASTLVFVGNVDPRRDRPMVRRAVEAGVPLAVWGRGWHDLPPGIWRGEFVPNDQLPRLYAEHGVVLADHWPDMARHGFVANRVFDAVAAGAHVISDDVVGLGKLFDLSDVTVATTPTRIATAFSALASTSRDSTCRTSLTFDDRARTLLDLARNA